MTTFVLQVDMEKGTVTVRSDDVGILSGEFILASAYLLRLAVRLDQSGIEEGLDSIREAASSFLDLPSDEEIMGIEDKDIL